MRLTLVLAGLLLLLGGSACGERAEPTGSLVPVYPVTVQGAGDQSTVAKAVPRRIVPLGAGPRRLLKALGLERRTVTVNDTPWPKTDGVRPLTTVVAEFDCFTTWLVLPLLATKSGSPE